MCIRLSIKRSQALGCLSSPLALVLIFVGHFQSSYLHIYNRTIDISNQTKTNQKGRRYSILFLFTFLSRSIHKLNHRLEFWILNILLYKFVTQNPGKEYKWQLNGILLFSKRVIIIKTITQPSFSKNITDWKIQKIYI